MPEFKIGVPEVHIQYYKVNADDIDTAKEKISNQDYDVDLLEDEFSYSHTLDKDQWKVEEVDNDPDRALVIDQKV